MPQLYRKAIDVQPGDEVGCLNINGRGKIPVAILSEDEGDASAIIQESLQLKFERIDDSVFALPVHIKKNGSPHCAVEDVDGDGVDDLVCHFKDDLETYDGTLKDSTATVDGAYYNQANEAAPFLGIPDAICIVKQPEPLPEPEEAAAIAEKLEESSSSHD